MKTIKRKSPMLTQIFSFQKIHFVGVTKELNILLKACEMEVSHLISIFLIREVQRVEYEFF